MFAPKAAKPQTKAAASSASNLTHQRSTLLAHRSGYYSAEQALFLQRTIGNQATLRYLTQRLSNLPAKPPGEQRPPTAAPPRRLAVGPVDDPLEHEADGVADKVMQAPASPQTTSAVFRETAAARTAPGIVDQALRSPGQLLDARTRSYFEPRFGFDFRTVRVHTDDAAMRSAAAIGARAYTYGSHILFAAGERPSADRLTAHELAHVVQNVSGGALPVIRRTPAVDPFEIISPVWNVFDRDVVIVRIKADGRTFFFYRRSGWGSKGEFQALAPKRGAWVPFEGFEEVEKLGRAGSVSTERFHKEPYYYSPAVKEGQVPPGYGTQTNKNIADWLDNTLPPEIKGTVANWSDVQKELAKYNPRNLPYPGTETPSPARTAAGEVTVPQRGSVTLKGGTAKPVTTVAGEIDVTPPTGGTGGRLAGIKAGVTAGVKGAFSAPSIASAVPEVILAFADRAAVREAARTISIKFAKEGFAKGVAAGVMEWSKEQVDSDLKNRVTAYRVQGLGDAAGILTRTYILQVAEAYENYAVDLGYRFSSSKTSKWKNGWRIYGLKRLDKYGYYFAGDPQVFSFQYEFIDKLAWVLHRHTDRIVDDAIKTGEKAAVEAAAEALFAP